MVAPEVTSGSSVLRARDIAVSFGGVRAVDGVSFQLEAGGASLGIVGPNGSGKSTLLNAISGVVRGTGHLEMGGRAIPLGRPRSVRSAGIARTFQTPQTFMALSCIENVLLGLQEGGANGLTSAWLRRPAVMKAERRRWARACDELDRVGLLDLAEESSSTLAYGQQRLLELARALAGDPRMLLLDEPAAGLNAAETAHLQKLLTEVRGRGVSLLLVEHKIDFVTALSDRLLVLELGHAVAEGAPADVWQEERVIDAYLGRPTASAQGPSQVTDA